MSHYFVKDKFTYTGGLWCESTTELKGSFGSSSMRWLPNTSVQWTSKECYLQYPHKRFPRKRWRWLSHVWRPWNNFPRYVYIYYNFNSLSFHFLSLSIKYYFQYNYWILIGITTAEVLEQYFQKHSPVHSGVEWRISYKDSKKENFSTNFGTTHQFVGKTILLTLSIITWLSLT